MLNHPIKLVCIGGSAGAIEALGALLPRLPAETPFPIAVVVHLPAKEPSLLSQIFAPRCALPVREIKDKDPLAPGIWFAPPDYHVLIEPSGTFALSVEEPVHFSRPSIDVLFETAADALGPSVVALVLTSASDDGAQGAQRIQQAGGRVWVQAPTEASAPILPRAVLALLTPHLTGTLSDLALSLCQLAEEGSRP